MRIVSIASQRVRWPIEARGAARALAMREAVLIELRDDRGTIGLGEAAPLPGVSPDTLADADQAIAAFAARLPLEVGDLFAVVAELTTAPAARFALETALLSIAACRAGRSLAEVLAGLGVDGPSAWLRCAVVVDTLDEASAAVAAGAGVLKLKVGPDLDLPRLEAIAALGVRLRLDANRAWSLDEARTHLAALAHLPIDFIEEPCAGARALLPGPIALDESLIADRAIDPRLAAVILKPTLLGGLRASLELAAAARAAGVPAIVTHALEGPIGTAACAGLALALGGDHAVGLAPHPGIAGWSIGVPQLGLTSIHACAAPGLGLTEDLASIGDASPALSIRAARGLAVLTADRTLSYAELATAAHPPIRSLVATPELATLEAIYAALESRTPIALHHHHLATGEIERQRAQLRAIPPGTAVVLFTSGSTGAARGVAVSRHALLAACEASALGWRDDDRWLLALSLAHAGGLAVAVRCLAARKPIVFLDGDFDAPRVAHLIAAHRVTLASLVPAQLGALLDDPAWHPPAHLRAVLLGGAAASPALLAAAAARRVPFLVTYGMTETFGQIATARSPGDPHAPLVALPNVTLAGGTATAPAPLRVRGPMLATAYLDGTPIAPELVTSDLGFVTDTVHILGRADDIIITGGENVHPFAVEAVVSGTPGVRAACAFGVADPRWGQVVAIALAVDATFELAVARARWHADLPSHARPRRIAIVDGLPMLPTGKPDRRAASRLPTTALGYRP